eukprot:IDg3278t1
MSLKKTNNRTASLRRSCFSHLFSLCSFPDIPYPSHQLHVRSPSQREISKDNPPPKRDSGDRLIPPNALKPPVLRRPSTGITPAQPRLPPRSCSFARKSSAGNVHKNIAQSLPNPREKKCKNPKEKNLKAAREAGHSSSGFTGIGTDRSPLPRALRGCGKDL